MIGNTQSDTVNLEGQPWALVADRPDLSLKVYQSVVPNMALVRQKGVCVFTNITPEQLAGFVFNHARRLEWDSGCLGMKVQVVGDHSQVRADGRVMR